MIAQHTNNLELKSYVWKKLCFEKICSEKFTKILPPFIERQAIIIKRCKKIYTSSFLLLSTRKLLHSFDKMVVKKQVKYNNNDKKGNKQIFTTFVL